jgi:hypothetical protein
MFLLDGKDSSTFATTCIPPRTLLPLIIAKIDRCFDHIRCVYAIFFDELISYSINPKVRQSSDQAFCPTLSYPYDCCGNEIMAIPSVPAVRQPRHVAQFWGVAMHPKLGVVYYFVHPFDYPGVKIWEEAFYQASMGLVFQVAHCAEMVVIIITEIECETLAAS